MKNNHICPNCHSYETEVYDRVKRTVIIKYGEKITTWIYRYKCSKCGHIFRALPQYVIPYKHYHRSIIEGVISGTISDETEGYEDYPSLNTMRKWKKSSH